VSPSHARALQKGGQVQILRTENVQQRAPHLIGLKGVIVEVPQHPNTWFKVRFSHGKTYTFRPSALKLVKSLDGEDEPENRESKAHGSMLLSAVDADVWINKLVRIKGGRFTGHTGRVLRSGNGWVQLQTAMGEVAKRAYELQLLPSSEQDQEPSGPPEPEKSRKRGREGEGGEHAEDGEPRKGKGKRGRGDHGDGEGPGPARARAGGGGTGRGRRGHGSAAAQRIAESRAALERYTEHIRKHLERQMEKAKERPNLSWWLKEFKAGRDDGIGREKDVMEIGPPLCTGCGGDMAFESSFCWNEACEESSLYYGCREAARKVQAELDGQSASEAKESIPEKDLDTVKAEVDQIDSFLLSAPAQWLETKRKRCFTASPQEGQSRANARKRGRVRSKGKQALTSE